MVNEELNNYSLEGSKILERIIPERRKLAIKETMKTMIGVMSLLLFFTLIMIIPVGLLEDRRILTIGLTVTGSLIIILTIITWVMMNLYVNSLEYIFTDKEIIKNAGIITRSRKIVPYRTITNFSQKMGPLDRLIGGRNFGTIIIETAGISGKAVPEQTLQGIENVPKYLQTVHNIVGKMKGQAAVITDEEGKDNYGEAVDPTLKEILKVLKEISAKIK